MRETPWSHSARPRPRVSVSFGSHDVWNHASVCYTSVPVVCYRHHHSHRTETHFAWLAPPWRRCVAPRMPVACPPPSPQIARWQLAYYTCHYLWAAKKAQSLARNLTSLAAPRLLASVLCQKSPQGSVLPCAGLPDPPDTGIPDIGSPLRHAPSPCSGAGCVCND